MRGVPVDRKTLDLFLTESDLMQVSASAHIITPFRADLKKRGFIKSTSLKWKADGTVIKTAGRVIIIHTPPTRSGKRVMFLTLEDEDGLFDLTVFEDVQARYAKKILASAVLLVEGVLNRFGLRGVSVVARRFWTIREFYERTYDDRAKIFSPAPFGRSSPQRAPRQIICSDFLTPVK
jgi:error-prone DNA polymerase